MCATMLEESTSKLPNGRSGRTFGHRREDIFKRIRDSAEQCKLNYSNRKELATDEDETVLELCEALEETFSYGLRQPESNIIVSAASIIQNMQEIVTGNAGNSNTSVNGVKNGEITFWDFCQEHLTHHERERYEQLKHIWNKCGRGKAFIRATLNEGSLQRYLLIWLDDKDKLERYYTGWSLLTDTEKAKQLPMIIGSLDNVLFALNVDNVVLNTPSKTLPNIRVKEEPIIYAPSPLSIESNTNRHRRKVNAVERPIETANNATENIINVLEKVDLSLEIPGSYEIIGFPQRTPTPDISEIKSPEQYLPDFPLDATSFLESEDKQDVTIQTNSDGSDTSSLYSKSSSANLCIGNQNILEDKLREVNERCAALETEVAKLKRENRLLERRLTKCFLGSGIDPNSSLASNFLITIPNVKLMKGKASTSSYYTYDIHITFRSLEHWSVLRRYKDFYKLHKSLLKTHPFIASIEFPPKKHFGNMNLVFVEERRQQLQIYLLNLAETIPQIEACKSKAELQKAFPFLKER